MNFGDTIDDHIFHVNMINLPSVFAELYNLVPCSINPQVNITALSEKRIGVISSKTLSFQETGGKTSMLKNELKLFYLFYLFSI